MQRIGWRRVEVEALVESTRIVILGMNQNRARANLVCRTSCADKGILEQSRPKPLALLPVIHGQTRKEDYGDRVPSEALPDPLRRFLAFNASSRERIVTNHPLIPMDDEHASSACSMIHQSVSTEPVRQSGLAAIELGGIVSSCEGFDACESTSSQARWVSLSACASAASPLPDGPEP